MEYDYSICKLLLNNITWSQRPTSYPASGIAPEEKLLSGKLIAIKLSRCWPELDRQSHLYYG